MPWAQSSLDHYSSALGDSTYDFIRSSLVGAADLGISHHLQCGIQ